MRLEIEPADEGGRLDRVVADAAPDLSRSRVQRLIEQGEVRVNGEAARASTRLHTGDVVTIRVPPPEKTTVRPEALPLDILFEDDHLLVLDKPPGMTVHPAGKVRSGTLVNALLGHCSNLSGINGVLRPGIVHRLDKDTSGVMVVAKDDAAHRGLAAQFEQRSVERSYRALLWGAPDPAEGRIEGAIGRHPKDRKRMAVLVEGGRQAATRYCVERVYPFLAEVVFRLETGRTHQIRVHAAHIGHPVFGDPTYGGRRKRLKGISPSLRSEAVRLLKRAERQMLHAERLGFVHPLTGERHRFLRRPPDDMAAVMRSLLDWSESAWGWAASSEGDGGRDSR